MTTKRMKNKRLAKAHPDVTGARSSLVKMYTTLLPPSGGATWSQCLTSYATPLRFREILAATDSVACGARGARAAPDLEEDPERRDLFAAATGGGIGFLSTPLVGGHCGIGGGSATSWGQATSCPACATRRWSKAVFADVVSLITWAENAASWQLHSPAATLSSSSLAHP